jgi:hypothetical protein
VAFGGARYRGQDAHESSFAGAIRAEQAEDSGLQFQREVSERPISAAVSLAYIFNREMQMSSASHSVV